MAMLLKEGYISGGQTWNTMDCGYPKVALTRPELTMKGSGGKRADEKGSRTGQRNYRDSPVARR